MIQIKQDYFEWLCEMVHCDGPSQSYNILLKTLHGIPFFVKNQRDLNRIDDGYRLRIDYDNFNNHTGRNLESLYQMKTSVLEVLIGLANRMEDIMFDAEKGDQTIIWFWEMIDNLGLGDFTDSAFGERRWYTLQVEEIIEKWMDRRFRRNGKGSPFPLETSKNDQRKIELIYQMNYYLDERYPI